MATSIFSVADFRAAILRLLPPGPIWPRASGSMVSAMASVWAPTFQRNGQRAANLLTDSFPATAVELLPEWEATFNLPDPCAGPNPLLTQRQAQVVARLTDGGGCSEKYYINFAKTLGYDITITRFSPARFGQARFGDRYLGAEWAFVWQVNCPDITIVPARFGHAQFGDPYRSWGLNVLGCEMRARAPARTQVIFNFSGGNPGYADSFVADVSAAS